MTKRVTFTVMISGPPGGSKQRLIQALRDHGYTVLENKDVGRGVIQLRVLTPHGEVNR